MAPKQKKVPDKNHKGRQHALNTIQPKAAGIDLGSREHFVAGPPLPDGSPNVKRFGTTTPELLRLAGWLEQQKIATVAMESTGVYWIPLFEILDSRGFDVHLVNARQIAHVPGRKTDMIDSQWIQLLHACGLLRGSFRPGDDICRLRALIRERNTILNQRSDWVRRIQKSLDQMNVCVHHAVSDITGHTGMAIIRAIAGGERDPLVLAGLRDRRCQKSESQIAEELTGNWRPEHLFNLGQALRVYDELCAVIADYDAEILKSVDSLQSPASKDSFAPPPASKDKANKFSRRGQEPMRQALYRMSGVDLTTIDGIGVDTAAVFMSELGPDLSAFPDEGHFISYLRLAPNISVSAGKKVPGKFRAVTSTRVSNALRMAATTLRNSKTALGAYYRRISRRKGASVAVFATARKLAQLIFRLVRYGQAYADTGSEVYEARFIQRRLATYTRALKEMGFKIEPLAA
ncbi:MAG: IS110 family transposase [Syntrophobacteraceae bacterium]|nr:IS110 family transposase [Syntrophobacteraceae bacterium]